MLPKNEFLSKYHFDSAAFEATGFSWAELERVGRDYAEYQQQLKPTAGYLMECLGQIKEVHSLRMRLKDPEHLVEKIIRKKIENPSFSCDLEHYREKVTDLLGLRALHLFKEDWRPIHEFITSQWDQVEKPTANVRKGDPEVTLQTFRERGCEINEHKYGYRSVHYIVKSQPSKSVHIAEIQVRTIFEEGWSEVDHTIRYPYDKENELLMNYLLIFNSLAGSADEMASYIMKLKQKLDQMSQDHIKTIKERDEISVSLRTLVSQLRIEKKQKADLEEKIQLLSTQVPSIGGGFIINQPNMPFPASIVTNAGIFSNFGSGTTLWLGTIQCSKCGKPIEPNQNLIYAGPPLCNDCRSKMGNG